MHTHPPIDPDDPSGATGEDVREPPLPEPNGRRVKNFRAKAISWTPNPRSLKNRR